MARTQHTRRSRLNAHIVTRSFAAGTVYGTPTGFSRLARLYEAQPCKRSSGIGPDGAGIDQGIINFLTHTGRLDVSYTVVAQGIGPVSTL